MSDRVTGMDIDTLLAQAPRYPRRIACLTEEPTETLYRPGCGDLVVGVSSFTLRPEPARHKPKASSFLDANFERSTVARRTWALSPSPLAPLPRSGRPGPRSSTRLASRTWTE